MTAEKVVQSHPGSSKVAPENALAKIDFILTDGTREAGYPCLGLNDARRVTALTNQILRRLGVDKHVKLEIVPTDGPKPLSKVPAELQLAPGQRFDSEKLYSSLGVEPPPTPLRLQPIAMLEALELSERRPPASLDHDLDSLEHCVPVSLLALADLETA